MFLAWKISQLLHLLNPTTAGGATGGGNSDDDDPIQTPQISPSEIYITIGGESIKGVLVDKILLNLT